MKKNNPKISIITVVYNGEKYLEDTIKSVINQTYSNIEYIIIDGGSTDGTVDIIKKYEDKIAYWISEKDRGIYDAINKGIKVSSGDYIGVIGGDDTYYIDAIEAIANNINKSDKKIDLIYGNIAYVDENNTVLKKKKSSLPNEKFFMIKGMSIPHIGSFVRSDIYGQYGDYDLSFKYASDYEYYLKLYLNNIHIDYIDHYITNFRNTGVTNNYMLQSNIEVFLIRKRAKIGFALNTYFLIRTLLAKYLYRLIKK